MGTPANGIDIVLILGRGSTQRERYEGAIWSLRSSPGRVAGALGKADLIAEQPIANRNMQECNGIGGQKEWVAAYEVATREIYASDVQANSGDEISLGLRGCCVLRPSKEGGLHPWMEKRTI